MDKNGYLKQYYGSYREDARLSAAKHGLVEYLTTMKYIHKFLEQGMRILEVGAGTGRYSLALAKEGFRVDAVELLEHNLNILRSKTEDGMRLQAVQGDALDLSRYQENTFDITLLLGPMYHLYKQDDRKKALEEAARVTRENGILYIAYCMNDPTVVGELFARGTIYDCLEKGKLTEDFHFTAQPEDLFALVRTEDIAELDQSVQAERICLTATDGATGYMRPVIDNMNDEQFGIYMKYHLAVCERQDLIGASHHTLDILRKKTPASGTKRE